jgi:CHAT domain-containing protein/Flp pilus assembly protein TadD
MCRRPLRRAALAIPVLTALSACSPSAPGDGAVVLTVEPWGAAATAGILAGDVIVAWHRESRSGPIGPATLELRRRGRLLRLAPATDEWEMVTRPVLTPSIARLHDQVLEAARNAEVDGALRTEVLVRRLAQELETEERDLALWARLELGRTLARVRRWSEAEEAFDAAARLAASDADPERTVVCWYAAGRAWEEARRMADAESAYRRALELQQELDPGSIRTAYLALRVVPTIRSQQGAGAVVLLEQASVTLDRLAPRAMLRTRLLRELGATASRRGDFEGAEELFEEGIALRMATLPRSPTTASLWSDLGLAVWEQGEIDRAEAHYRRSLAIYDAIDPENRGAAYASNFLGLLTRDKGEPEQARTHFERALRIFRTLNPESFEVAGMLNNLAVLCRKLGDLEQSESYHRQALAIRERLDPESLAVAASLNNLGILARHRGELAEARALLEQARGIKERHEPESLTLANTFFELALVARGEGDLERAEDLHRRALEIRRTAVPESELVAVSQISLAEVLLDAGRVDEAVSLWQIGLDRLDRQRDGLSFTEYEKSLLASRFQDLYRGLADLLATEGRVGEAYDLLERSRARALRVMVASPGGSQSAAGGSRAAYEPAPAKGWRELRSSLEPGTVLLSYSVSAEDSRLFVLSRELAAPVAHPLGISRQELELRTEVFRALIERGRRGGEIEEALLVQGAGLFATLLGPALDTVMGAERLVIVPDHPLHALPLAALVRRPDPVEYLVEWKPLTVSFSATLYAGAAAADRSREASATHPFTGLLAFGDPRESATGTGAARPELPASREEVKAVAAFTGDRARVYTGEDATEARVKALAGTASVLHFATHAMLDQRFPLRSALVLAGGEGEDGLLRAGEILGELALDADMVVLSGCETGLGGQIAGEGVVGLSYAFRAAGARTLAVTLWRIADRSAAALMSELYRRLAAGARPAEALQAAQVHLLASPATRHPFHWASFQIVGGKSHRRWAQQVEGGEGRGAGAAASQR